MATLRLRRVFAAAEHDERLARAIGRLADAGHEYNRWEPNIEAFDALLDAALGYADAREDFLRRMREEK